MEVVNLNLLEKALAGTIDCMPFQENELALVSTRIDQVYEELGWPLFLKPTKTDGFSARCFAPPKNTGCETEPENDFPDLTGFWPIKI